MAFPTEGLVTNVSVHTIGTSKWTWNGYAWDRQIASGDIHGHTGDTLVDSFNGLTGDVTTNALILPVTGITSSGGATFDGHITFSGDHNILNSSGQTVFAIQSGLNVAIGDVGNDGNLTDISVRDSHSEIIANAALRVKLDTPIVNILGGGVLGSKTDTDTYVNFADSNLTNFVAGGITYATGTVLGISFDVGATFGADVAISNGNDLISDGSSSFQIIQNGNQVAFFDDANGVIRFPIYSLQIEDFLTHSGDSDTHLRFDSNRLRLTAGDNTGLDMTATETTLDGVTFTDGKIETLGNLDAAGATFTSNVTLVTDSGDIALTVKADTDNNNENDNPLIRLEQDGGAISTSIGMLGDDDAQFSGSLANMFYIEADGSAGNHTHGIQFATANTARMTIDSDGDVGIGTKTPQQKLDVNGTISTNGISCDGNLAVEGTTNFLDNDVSRSNLKDYSEHVNAIGTITGNTAISFADGNVQTVTGNGNCEFSFTNPPASGKAGTLTLIITNGGANTTTFASPVKWPSDVAPSLTSSGVDILSFVTTDAGSNIFGFVGGLNFS